MQITIHLLYWPDRLKKSCKHHGLLGLEDKVGIFASSTVKIDDRANVVLA